MYDANAQMIKVPFGVTFQTIQGWKYYFLSTNSGLRIYAEKLLLGNLNGLFDQVLLNPSLEKASWKGLKIKKESLSAWPDIVF